MDTHKLLCVAFDFDLYWLRKFSVVHAWRNKMKIRQILFLSVAAGALLLQACAGANPQAAIDTAVAQTLQISELQTAAAGGGVGTAAPLASDTPGPSATPSQTATITLTPTPSIPYVRVGENTNCRRGPSMAYSIVMVLNVGEQSQVLKTFGNDYVVVDNLDGDGDCWLWLNYATPASFAAYNLPVATQPPTPTATLTPTPGWDWEGSWNGYLDLGGGTLDLCTMSLDVSGNNISGSYDCGGGLTGTITGSLSNGGQNASGTWLNTFAVSGDFDWQIKSGNHNQFVGNYESGGSNYAWCGARAGSSTPNPCYWP